MMKTLSWTALVVGVLALSVGLAGAGCGSESEETTNPDGSAGEGGGLLPAGEGGACKLAGTACTVSTECCTANCDAKTKMCAAASAACGAPGSACAAVSDCCTFSCVGAKCSDKQCIADNGACTADGECCGAKCDAGKCTPLNGSCRTSGNPCAANGECCSKSCNNGVCDASPSFCTQNGDTCAADFDCCGGLCTKATGATVGLCSVAAAPGATGCTPAGQLCGDGAAYTGGPIESCGGDCCSRSCRPYAATGILVCQPPSGCHPTGELCQDDKDCCGALGTPTGSNDETKVVCSKATGATIGRCDNGNKCTPAGAICRLQTISCNANANCCAGNVLQKNTCKQDALGIPRCLVAEVDCTAAPATFAGKACASSADCCNLPCVSDATGKLVCLGTKCVPTGDSCTTTADCCAGSPCVLQPGSTKGTCGPSGGTGGTPGTDGGTGGGGTGGSTTCAQYGQSCDASTPCCNNVPCTGGYCTTLVR